MRHILSLRSIDILHIDEAQHVLHARAAGEIQKVRDTIKGLLQSHRPVSIVLSGLPDVASLINEDRQLRRRTRFVHFTDLTTEHRAPIEAFLHKVVTVDANLTLVPLETDDLVSRLLCAAESQLGIICELAHDAVDEALRASSSTLRLEHFALAFGARTGCSPDTNPFQPGAHWVLDNIEAQGEVEL